MVLNRKGTRQTGAVRAVALLCVCLLLLCASVFAQTDKATPTNPEPVTLQECIDIALQKQTDLIVAGNSVNIAQSSLQESISEYLPQVAVENNAFSSGTGVLDTTSTGTALSVGLNIFDGGVREANVKASRYGVKQSKAYYERTKQSTIYDVTSAFYEALRAGHLAQVQEANVKYYEELRDQVKYQAEVGSAAKVDVLPVEAELANAQVDLLSAQNTVRTATLTLQTTIGLTPESGFSIKEANDIPEIDVLALDEYVSYARKNRPDIDQALFGIESARATVRAKRISIYPRPVIEASYQQSIHGGFRSNGTQLVGGISFNLFDGGASQAAYKSAKASQANAQENALQLAREIRADVETAYLNLNSSQQRLAATKISLDSAKKNLEAQQERYATGLAITLDVLNAQVQYTTAQSDSVEAQYDYLEAIAQLEYATGKQGGATWQKVAKTQN
ncbi:MAG: TolC family protein [Armatimonadota bacterium]|nr:TolC family protein [bacterium]